MKFSTFICLPDVIFVLKLHCLSVVCFFSFCSETVFTIVWGQAVTWQPSISVLVSRPQTSGIPMMRYGEKYSVCIYYITLL